MAVYVTRATERLRRGKLAAGIVTVFINTNRFSAEPQYGNSLTYELAYSTDAMPELLDWALKGLERIYRAGYGYKQGGVMPNRPAPADRMSVRVFGDGRFERPRRLMKAVDEINRPHGHDAVRFDTARPDGCWKTKSQRRSQNYTTSLEEVLRVP